MVLLGLPTTSCQQAGATSIIAGDFNASIGTPLPGDDFTVFGRCGTGNRRDRGVMLTGQHTGSGRGFDLLATCGFQCGPV